jgi:hypothetical protein
MKTNPSNVSRWLTVATFAVAMAWVESAAVFYLRTLVGRIEPHQPDPLPILSALGPVELVRELATMLMLLTVGVLAGRTWRARLGYSAIAFGVWDISYYVFLKIMCDWPRSLFDWDVLFLLPLPWWGPVLAPMLIAVLLIAWGTLASRTDRVRLIAPSDIGIWALSLVGVALALYVFMADALRVVDQGVEVIRNVLPERFNWPLFCVALALMAAPMIQECRELWRRPPSALNLEKPNGTGRSPAEASL